MLLDPKVEAIFIGWDLKPNCTEIKLIWLERVSLRKISSLIMEPGFSNEMTLKTGVRTDLPCLHGTCVSLVAGGLTKAI